MIADIWRVVREWRVYFEGFGVPVEEIEKIAPAFRHFDDVTTPTPTPTPTLRKLLP